MRLLHRDAQDTYHLKEIADALEEHYAILSHRWYPDGDILYADLANQHRPEIRNKQGWRKLQYAVDQAERDGYRYVWIDTCCIDKTSSAELSEAINSMFFWTLQELIAPREVLFFGVDWNRLGSSHQLVKTIAARTLIDADLLRGRKKLERYSIAQRMSWAADRVTSRIEDRAYSLLGLFDVNIPLLYGEREKAFMRLQEEIIHRSNDESILAWGCDMSVDETPGRLLARSPADFRGSSGIVPGEEVADGKALQLDNRALRGTFLVRYEGDGLWTAMLNCKDSRGGSIKLSIIPQKSDRYEERNEGQPTKRFDYFNPKRLKPLIANNGLVAVAKSGNGFCSRTSSSRVLPVHASQPVDAWPNAKKDDLEAMLLAYLPAKLRIVTSESYRYGPLRLSICPFKEHDRGSLEVLFAAPWGRIPTPTADLAQDPMLRPIVTRFTYNDAAALLIRIKHLNEALEVTCTAAEATWVHDKSHFVCDGSLVVRRGTRKMHDPSCSIHAWRNYEIYREHRFSGHAATVILTLKDGWKFSTRMTVVGMTEPEVELEFETLPPPTSRMGKMGALKRLIDREDGNVEFEAA
ncbi:hypothetical protein KC331_g12736 [Hortaea werneckii]|uniref:Uncharacterized protein n=1 Tax=Hortaea werneckii TaxID=91943 RepID=A0A3M7APN6_HORWE|nr:hypothetical protein KC331_g12736 [Hortaea werneckii]KAI7709592.1 hypothetical protein KC353_g10267 [Hortaea werneckii]RMY29535.1 hypothetical protein D0865_15493 [Hortaea werneckii]